jgi:hypothetical protein
MSGPEQAYLALVIGAMLVFMVALGWASLRYGEGRTPEERQRADVAASAARSTTPRISAVKSRA